MAVAADRTTDFLPGADEGVNGLLRFSAEAGGLASILRQTLLADGSRRENDAEHSWHVALMAMLFKDYAPPGCDVSRAVRMCIVHDLVEIRAGDTFAYDAEGARGKKERERKAADELFGGLPDGAGGELRALWEEFDGMKTPDAAYAAAMDRLQPFLHNVLTGGYSWKKHGVSAAMVSERMAPVVETIPALKSWFAANLARAVREKWLRE